MQVPFGGSFYNLVQWCAWTEERSGKVRLQVSCDVVYTKRWVPAKGIINSSSIEVGTNDLLLQTQRLLGASQFGLLKPTAPSLSYSESDMHPKRWDDAMSTSCSVSNAADISEQFGHEAEVSHLVTCQCLQPDAASMPQNLYRMVSTVEQQGTSDMAQGS